MIRRLTSLARESGNRLRLCAAMRQTLREGYSVNRFRDDVLAGLVVGIIALPLSMALAIASGVGPQHGLYTAIIGGALIAILGGSRVQVSGPTAAFVVILAPIAANYGPGGLLLAGAMAGVLLIGMGLCRFGTLIEFIPYPVTTGFTFGIAVVIAVLQVKDFFGLTVEHMPDHFIERAGALMEALPTIRPADAVVGTVTLVALILWPRLTRRVPAALVALTLGAVVAAVLGQMGEGMSAATIQSRFSFVKDGVTVAGIPQVPPTWMWPWQLPWKIPGNPDPSQWEAVQALFPSAVAIAMLGAIESLLSAVVADGLIGDKHDSDGELIAQGIGNMVAPFFGGIAATGALARTAANIRSGGRSPVAAVVHALFILLAVVGLAPVLGYVPMASMAALLVMVAWNMSEAKHLVHVMRVAPWSDKLVLAMCLSLTVVFDMVVAVGVGVVLAAMLFMRRMAEVSEVRLVGQQQGDLAEMVVPPGVVVYEVAGPMFFGATHKAMSALRTVGDGVRVVVLDLRAVPVLDATGLVNLESAVDRLGRDGVHVVLGGVQQGPLKLLAQHHVRKNRGNLVVRGGMEDALAVAAAIAADAPPGRSVAGLATAG
jgi:SulP family sulfate permease